MELQPDPVYRCVPLLHRLHHLEHLIRLATHALDGVIVVEQLDGEAANIAESGVRRSQPLEELVTRRS